MEECTNLCNIGERIRLLREKKSVTQQQMANDFKVRREVIAKWETGVQDFKTENIIKIADYFGVTCDFLLTGHKAENVDIHKELGLSDEAITALTQMNHGLAIEIVNGLLCDGIFREVILKLINIKGLSMAFDKYKLQFEKQLNENEKFTTRFKQETGEDYMNIDFVDDVEDSKEDESEENPPVFYFNDEDFNDDVKKIGKIICGIIKSMDLERYTCERSFRKIVDKLAEKGMFTTFVEEEDD